MAISLVWFIGLLSIVLGPGALASHHVFRNLQTQEFSAEDQPYRTSFHFQPPKNWINDPNGPMYHNGVYHLFYQYNPYGAVWGNIVWAHSVSSNLIDWDHLDHAIYPTAPFDINGCWSGSATILPGNKPVILYTGIDTENRQVQNIAVPKNLADPLLREWIKPPRNSLMAPINGINSSSFRDPTTGWQGPDGRWRVVVGNKRRRRGMALLYRSKDFVNWIKAQHPLHSSKNTGMWECPDFFPVLVNNTNGVDTSVISPSVKHVLKVSLDDLKHEYYTIGTYDHEKDKYVPDGGSVDDGTGLRYDYGKFYASKTFFDNAKNRRILWGWINESDSVANDVQKGWSGIQAIPRSVWLDRSGRQLVQWPIVELEELREKRVDLHNVELKGGSLMEVTGLKASQADVEVSFEMSKLEEAEIWKASWVDPQQQCSNRGASFKRGVGPFGLLVLASKGLEEYTSVFFYIFKDNNKHVVLLCSDQSRSSLSTEVDKTSYGGFVDVDPRHGKLSLRSLIDHSIVESFGGEGRTCITARVYPKLAINEDAHLYVFNNGSASVKISSLSAWDMKKAMIK